MSFALHRTLHQLIIHLLVPAGLRKSPQVSAALRAEFTNLADISASHQGYEALSEAYEAYQTYSYHVYSVPRCHVAVTLFAAPLLLFSGWPYYYFLSE